MLRSMIRHGMVLILLSSFMSGFAHASSQSEFSKETLLELATKAETVWREFGLNK
jgi:hypothetical protein